MLHVCDTVVSKLEPWWWSSTCDHVEGVVVPSLDPQLSISFPASRTWHLPMAKPRASDCALLSGMADWLTETLASPKLYIVTQS